MTHYNKNNTKHEKYFFEYTIPLNVVLTCALYIFHPIYGSVIAEYGEHPDGRLGLTLLNYDWVWHSITGV